MSAEPRVAGEVRRHVLRRRRRLLTVAFALLAAAFLVSAVTLTTGSYATPLRAVIEALTGSGDARTRFVLTELRLPRLGLALSVGAALGAAGALFQSLTGNPLGSPDVVGFTTGAATGALVAILLLPAGTVSPGAGAVLGGAVTALLVLLIGGTGPRLVLVGIGLAAFGTSVNAYLLTRAEVTDAQNAAVWLVGTLNGRGAQLSTVALLLVLLLPLALWCGRGLRLLENGELKAASLGIGIARQRAAAAVVAVALTGAAVAGAGPVVFVALAAPHLARRLTRIAAPLVATSALLGAVLLAAADLLAQRVVPGQQIPVGAMTGILGGVYLAVLLGRRGSSW